jgi:hypothetical protein
MPQAVHGALLAVSSIAQQADVCEKVAARPF